MNQPFPIHIPHGGFGAYSDLESTQPLEKIERYSNLLNSRPPNLPRILLIDDDPLFCMKMARMAEVNDFPLERMESLPDAEDLSYWAYDLVILDYDLGETNGLDVAAFIEETIGDIPVVLVSNTPHKPSEGVRWPSIIREFVNKDQGTDLIFEQALKLYGQSK